MFFFRQEHLAQQTKFRQHNVHIDDAGDEHLQNPLPTAGKVCSRRVAAGNVPRISIADIHAISKKQKKHQSKSKSNPLQSTPIRKRGAD